MPPGVLGSRAQKQQEAGAGEPAPRERRDGASSRGGPGPGQARLPGKLGLLVPVAAQTGLRGLLEGEGEVALLPLASPLGRQGEETETQGCSHDPDRARPPSVVFQPHPAVLCRTRSSRERARGPGQSRERPMLPSLIPVEAARTHRTAGAKQARALMTVFPSP